jgi:hypothetical protein
MSKTIKAIERHMIPPKSGIPSVSGLEARRGMATTRTRNTFRIRISKVALGPCATAAGDNRECSRLEGFSHDSDVNLGASPARTDGAGAVCDQPRAV